MYRLPLGSLTDVGDQRLDCVAALPSKPIVQLEELRPATVYKSYCVIEIPKYEPLDHGTCSIRQLSVSAMNMLPEPSIVMPAGAVRKALVALVPLLDWPDVPA